MNINTNSSVAELRTELDRKRKNALDLQMNTTDSDEWKSLNGVRWELEDLDKDLYLSQFIKNNEKISKLIGEIEASTEGAKKVVQTLDEIKNTLSKARSTLNKASSMFPEIDAFYTELEGMIKTLRA